MGKSINNIDLVPQEVLDDLKALDNQLVNTKKNLEALLESAKEISNTLAKSTTNYKTLVDTVNKLNDVEKKATNEFENQNKARTEIERLQKKIIELDSKEAKEIAELKEQIRQKNKENRDSAKAMLEEAAAAEKLSKKLNDVPGAKTTAVLVETGGESNVAKEAESAARNVERLQAAFNKITSTGFMDVSGLLKTNKDGMVDYSNAINTVSSRLAYISSLQDSYKSALDSGSISLEVYNQKMGVINTIQGELQQGFSQLNETYAKGKTETDNTTYSSSRAAEAFAGLSERSRELTMDLIEMNSEQNRVKSSLKELEDAYQSGEVQEEDYIQQKAELNTIYDANTKAIKAATKELALEVKVTDTVTGSYDNLSARYSLLKIKLDAMTASGKKNTEEFSKMEEEARNLYEEMKKLQSATGKNQLNVGDYPELPDWLEDAVSKLSQIPGASSQAAGGLNMVNTAAKALLANPIVAVIAAVIAAFSLLFSAFKRSESGSRMLEKAGNALKAVMMALITVVEKAARGLKSLFDDPVAAMKSFGEKFKNMITDRIKAAGDYIVSLKNAAVSLFKLDFKEMGKSLKEAGNDLLKLTTGFDTEDIKKGVNYVMAFTDAVDDYKNKMNELTDAQLEAKNRNEQLTRQVADLSAEEAKYSTIAQDITKSQKDRLDAEEKAHAAAKARSQAEFSIAKTNLGLVKRELELRKGAGENVDELKTRYTEAYSTMRRAEQQYITEVEKSQARRNKIIFENAVKEVDILTETTSNQIAINIRRTKNEEATHEERKKILDDSLKMLDNSLKAEVKVVQDYASDEIDIQSLITEQDQKAVNERIKNMNLPVQMQEKLLKIIKDYRQQKRNLDDADVESEKRRVNDILKEIKREANARGREIQEDEGKDNLDLSKKYAFGLMFEEVYQAKKNSIAKKYAMERFNAETSAIEQSLAQEGISEEERQKLKEQLGRKSLEHEQWLNEQEIRTAEDLANKKKELLQSVFAFGEQLMRNRFQSQQDDLEKQSEVNEEWANEETERIERMEESGAISKEQADARKALVDQQAQARENQIEEKKKELQKKQAKYDRAISVSKIAWSTAQAIMAAWELGPILGPVFAAIAAATGAVQLATVLATPIPEYAKGTKDHPGGLAIVGDGGKHEMVLANGMMYRTPNKDTLVDLPKHSVVLPDFNVAMNKLPVLPNNGQDRVLSFEGLASLLRDNNKQIKNFAGLYNRERRNNRYSRELLNVKTISR